VYDETQTFSIYNAFVREFAHIYSVFRAAFGSELFESFIRRDSLLTRLGKPDAGETRWNVEAHITGAFSMPVSTRLIRKMENGSDRSHEVIGRKFEFWIAVYSRWCCVNLSPLVTANALNGAVIECDNYAAINFVRVRVSIWYIYMRFYKFSIFFITKKKY